MGRSRSRKGGGLSDDEMRRYLKFMIIPFIVILLILVIVLTDKSPKQKEEKPSETAASTVQTSAEPVTETVQPDNKEYVQNFEDYELKKDEIPEIKALIEAYCEAKRDCDPEALAAVFGETLSPEELETERTKLEKTAQVVEGYENVVSYTKNGLTEDAYVVYPYYEIKFKDAQTPLPVLTMCYVQKNAEGKYVMTLDFDDTVAEYISKVNVSEDVRLLSAQVDAKVQEAVANDPALNSIYSGISAGASAAETESTTQAAETEGETGETSGTEASGEGTSGGETEATTEMDIQIN